MDSWLSLSLSAFNLCCRGECRRIVHSYPRKVYRWWRRTCRRRGCRNGEDHDLEQQVSGRATYRTMFLRSFTVAKGKTEGQYMSVAAIYKELKPKYGATLVGNSLISFGRKLKNIDGITHRHSSNGTENLIVRRYWCQNPGMTETDRYSINISFCQLLYFADILQVIKTEWQNDRFFRKLWFFVNLGGNISCQSVGIK